MAQWLGRPTRDQEVAGSTPGLLTASKQYGQVAKCSHTCAFVSKQYGPACNLVMI